MKVLGLRRDRSLGQRDVRVQGLEDVQRHFRRHDGGLGQDRRPISKRDAAPHLHVVTAGAGVCGEAADLAELGRTTEAVDDFGDREFHDV